MRLHLHRDAIARKIRDLDLKTASWFQRCLSYIKALSYTVAKAEEW